MTNDQRALFAILSNVSPLNDDEPAPWGTYPVRGESHTVMVHAKFMGRHWLEGTCTYYVDPHVVIYTNEEADAIAAQWADR